MLLSSLEDPSLDDNWLWGQRFLEPPAEPIEVAILPGYEDAELLDYFGTPPVMSDRFHAVLLGAGVSNLEVFNAVISSQDDRIRHEGFKAFNVIGIIAAASKETEYSEDNPSRLLDASIDKLGINAMAANGALMFRLSEYAGAIVVHEAVKQAIEAAGISHMLFQEPEDFVS